MPSKELKSLLSSTGSDLSGIDVIRGGRSKPRIRLSPLYVQLHPAPIFVLTGGPRKDESLKPHGTLEPIRLYIEQSVPHVRLGSNNVGLLPTQSEDVIATSVVQVVGPRVTAVQVVEVLSH